MIRLGQSEDRPKPEEDGKCRQQHSTLEGDWDEGWSTVRRAASDVDRPVHCVGEKLHQIAEAGPGETTHQRQHRHFGFLEAERFARTRDRIRGISLDGFRAVGSETLSGLQQRLGCWKFSQYPVGHAESPMQPRLAALLPITRVAVL